MIDNAVTAEGGPGEGAAPKTILPGISKLLDYLGQGSNQFKGLAEKIKDVPQLQGLQGPLLEISKFLGDIGSQAGSVLDGANSTFNEEGIVEGVLGGTPDGENEERGSDNGEGEEGTEGGSFFDKIKEKIGELKETWNQYYNDLWDKEGKLNTEKLKNIALEVGTTILGEKKMAKIKKVLAIGSVVRKTAEAVMEAAKVAFPGNIPAIAQAVALGAVQLSKVKGQAHDGINNIPSTGTYLLEKGERVVDNRLNTDLSSFLRTQGSSQNTSNTISNSHQNVTNSPVINMSFSGNVNEDSVRSNRGEIETMMREVFADYAMTAPFDAA